MDKIRRNERMSAMMKILAAKPNRIFTLSYFCDLFGSAKSTMSELISNEEPETPCHRRGGRALCLSGCRPERPDQRCRFVGSYSACCFPLGSRGLKKPLPDFL